MVHRANDNPNIWLVYETYETRADFDAHVRTAPVSAFLNSLDGKLTGELDIRLFDTEPFSIH